jgi:coenzyme F420-reducing hydrogenase beta subunit
MAKCDLCGKTCSAQDMEQLRNIFQVDGIVDLCPSCVKSVNKIKDDYLDKMGSHVRDEIRKRKGSDGGVSRYIGRGWF